MDSHLHLLLRIDCNKVSIFLGSFTDSLCVRFGIPLSNGPRKVPLDSSGTCIPRRDGETTFYAPLRFVSTVNRQFEYSDWR
jgi:hypothetical protein